jgi:hypothetical protein
MPKDCIRAYDAEILRKAVASETARDAQAFPLALSAALNDRS